MDEFPNNWSELVKLSQNASPPDFQGLSLGDRLFDFALDKATRNLSSELSMSFVIVKKRIIAELKNNRVAKQNATSTIRFLRDVNSDLFLNCPNCGQENDEEWKICDCGYEND